MKIKILTLPFNWNYGGILQNFALQHVLIKLGHQVETIDRVNEFGTFKQLFSATITRFIKKHILGEKIKLRPFPNQKELDIICQNTNKFIEENIELTTKKYRDNQLRHINKEVFDVTIVGSDQIWRPRYAVNIKNHFLEFLKNHNSKKISYASSLGTAEWEYNQNQTSEIKQLINSFDAISVREKSGVQLIEKYLNTNAVNTIDPTLLVDKTVYDEIAKKNKVNIPDNGLMTYILDNNEDIENLIMTCSKKHDLTPFTCRQQKYFHQMTDNNLSGCVAPSIEQWLDSFRKAKFVITDSYHGTIFSIIFNKPFISIGNMKRGLARFESLLENLDLKSRLVVKIDRKALELINTNIDYQEVNKQLDYLRSNCENFLKNSLSGKYVH